MCAARSRIIHPVFGQLALGVERPEDHYQMLHAGQFATALVWERHKPKDHWIKLNPDDPDIPDVLRAIQGNEDAFLTPNEFYGWRLVRLLASLRACYVDLDGCTDYEEVRDTLLANRIPEPSAFNFSGRGLHLYWLLEPLPPKALPVWQRVQDELIRVLAPLGADPAAKDCTRVLRVCGSYNSKNGEEVRGCILDGHRWSLRQLAFEVLGRDGTNSPTDSAEELKFTVGDSAKPLQSPIAILPWLGSEIAPWAKGTVPRCVRIPESCTLHSSGNSPHP